MILMPTGCTAVIKDCNNKRAVARSRTVMVTSCVVTAV